MNKKDTILIAATKLFSEKGFRETPMAELSKLTGAAEGTIFYHFKTKEDLFVAILENLREEIINAYGKYLAEKNFQNGIDRVEGAVAFYFFLASSMEERFLLIHRHDAYELAKGNQTCRNHLEAIYNCLVDIFEQAVVAGQQDGTILNLPARKTALIIFSMVDGLVRLNTYQLYDAGTLYHDVIAACRRMFESKEAPNLLSKLGNDEQTGISDNS